MMNRKQAREIERMAGLLRLKMHPSTTQQERDNAEERIAELRTKYGYTFPEVYGDALQKIINECRPKPD